MVKITLVTAILFAMIIGYENCKVVGNPLSIEIEKGVEIHGYHFHTYFFQSNEERTQEAINLRTAIVQQIDNGFLANCRLGAATVTPRPIGPHPIGSFETCCNKTSISPALTFFMQNHGNLSILLHPLTRYERTDHTARAMFLGPVVPLDTEHMPEDLGDELDLCLPKIF